MENRTNSMAPAGQPLGQPINVNNQVRSEYTELMELARRAPERDEAKLIEKAKHIGSILALSGKTDTGGCDAYYRFVVGGKAIQGPTIDLMESLEKVWKYTMSIVELDQEMGGRVTFRCKFIDFQTGTFKERPFSAAFSAPSKGWAKDAEQQERWRNMQMQAAVSKANRMILEHGLPTWFVNSAIMGARETLSKNLLRGRSIEAARAEAVSAWKSVQVSVPELEKYLGVTMPMWSPTALMELEELWYAIAKKETTLEDVFDPIREELNQNRAPRAEPAESGAPAPEAPASTAEGQQTTLIPPSPARKKAQPAALPEPQKTASEELDLPNWDRLPAVKAELATVTSRGGVDEVIKNAKREAPAEAVPMLEGLRREYLARFRD